MAPAFRDFLGILLTWAQFFLLGSHEFIAEKVFLFCTIFPKCCKLHGRYRIDRKVGLTVRIFGEFFECFVLVIKWRVVIQRGKCGCFVLIKNDLRSIWVPQKFVCFEFEAASSRFTTVSTWKETTSERRTEHSLLQCPESISFALIRSSTLQSISRQKTASWRSLAPMTQLLIFQRYQVETLQTQRLAIRHITIW